VIHPRAIWQKAKRDQALNLSELAIASGYPRGVLAKMMLPLQAGKLTLSDFKRIMRKRQNFHEGKLRRVNFKLLPILPPAASHPGDERSAPAIADRFYAPSSRHVAPAASRPARSAAPLRNTA
jgi:hypothetical protein